MRPAAVLLACLLTPSPAYPAFIVITETATGSGSLGGTPFTNALITLVSTGDTTGVARMSSGVLAFTASSTTVSVSGITANPVAFTIATSGFSNPINARAGIESGIAGGGGLDILTVGNASLASYDFMRSIGPLSGTTAINTGVGYGTTAGSFVISGISGNTGTVAVAVGFLAPEPASVVLLGIGLVGVGVMRRFRPR